MVFLFCCWLLSAWCCGCRCRPAMVSSVVVIAAWVHQDVRFALRDVVLNHVPPAQAAVACRHLRHRRRRCPAGGLCGSQGTTKLSPSSTTTRPWKRSINGVGDKRRRSFQRSGGLHRSGTPCYSFPAWRRRRIVDDLEVWHRGFAGSWWTSLTRTCPCWYPAAIAIEDLLGDQVPLIHGCWPRIRVLLCVTGAGGSIGSNFAVRSSRCFQRVWSFWRSASRRCIWLSRSSVWFCPMGRAVGRAGSAADPLLLQRLFVDQAVELVFHAAAYKHVPLVESIHWRVGQ